MDQKETGFLFTADLLQVVSATPTDMCPICYDNLNHKPRQLHTCGHVFHLHCIDHWLRLKKSCPVCRSTPKSTDL